MLLHLVGETSNKARSNFQAETGKLVQLMRGIYVDADDDIERSSSNTMRDGDADWAVIRTKVAFGVCDQER